MDKRQLVLVLLAVCMVGLVPGCQPGASDASDGRFAAGAFPPTLSDAEYHERAWSRPTCLSCHEKGVEDAPLLKHSSVPEQAKGVKCRTCHVLEVGKKPAY